MYKLNNTLGLYCYSGKQKMCALLYNNLTRSAYYDMI